MDASKHKVTVIIEDDEFARFEAYCSRNGYKKSTLICRLIREHPQTLNDSPYSELSTFTHREKKTNGRT